MAQKQISLTGSDTLTIFNRNITSFATGDYFTFNFDQELFKVDLGKGGNAVYAFNSPGQVAKGILKVLRGSIDDIYLNSLLAAAIADPSEFILGDCIAVKRIGNGKGAIRSDVYIFGGGIFTKFPMVKGNQQGDTEQAIVSYEITFTAITRAVQ